MSRIIAEYPNIEYGITAVVTEINQARYTVTLRDDDSGQYVNHAYVYPTSDQAERKALTLV